MNITGTSWFYINQRFLFYMRNFVVLLLSQLGHLSYYIQKKYIIMKFVYYMTK